ncbi:MAG: hypothetical protein AB1546_05065, partial [bacterium]
MKIKVNLFDYSLIFLIFCVSMFVAPPNKFGGGTSFVSAQEEIEVELEGSAPVTFKRPEALQENPVAAVKGIGGEVMLRRAGNIVWESASAAMPIYPGDALFVSSDSTAEVELTDGSYLKLAPFTRIIFRMGKVGDLTVPLVEIVDGKVWGHIAGGEFPPVIQTAGGFINGQNSTFFVEIRIDTGTGCVDLLQGNLDIRSETAPDQIVPLASGSRIKLDVEKLTISTPMPIKESVKGDDLSHSCLVEKTEAIEEIKVGAIPVEEEGIVIANVTGTAMVTFISAAEKGEEKVITEDEGVVVFQETEGPAAEEAEKAEKVEGAVEAEAEEEYEVVEIQKTTVVSFHKAEEQAPAGTPTTPSAVAPTEEASVVPVEAETAAVSVEPVEVEETVTVAPETPTEEPASTEGVPAEEGIAEVPAEEETAEVSAEEAGVCTIGTMNISSLQPASLSISEETVSDGETTTVVLETCGSAVVKVTPANITSTDAEYDKWEMTVGDGEWTVLDAEQPAEITLTTPGSIAVAARLTNQPQELQYPAITCTIDFQKSVESPAVEITKIGQTAVVDPSEKLILYRDSLESGNLIIRGSVVSEAGCEISKVEVTTDGGGVWQEAALVGGGSWEYKFTPSEETYYINARATDIEENTSDELMQAIEVEYHHKTEEENLREVFERLIQAYINKDTLTFMEGASLSFNSSYQGIEDANLLENSLENKFRDYPVIYLKYQVQTVTISGTTGRVGFYWNAQSGTSGFPYYGTFIFEKDVEWKFKTLTDPDTFLRYTSEVKTITLTAFETILTADEKDTTDITAMVLDSANNPVKDGTIISFTATSGTITASGTTVNGGITITYTAGNLPGTV